MVSWVPLLLMALVAATLSAGVVRQMPIAVVDEDHSAISRELTRLLAATPAIRIDHRPASVEDAWVLARSAKVRAVVLIPYGAEREAYAGRQATITAFFNASYQTAGNLVLRDIGAAVAALGSCLALRAVAMQKGPAAVRPAPLAGRVTTLFNPEGSLEWNLVALIEPAILHLMLSLAVIAAVGRELRDATVREWLEESGDRIYPAIAGKLAPYVAIFSLQGVVSLLWLSKVRGWPVNGSALMLILGQILMYAAYAVVGLLVLGLARRMSTALSLAGVYAGAALAFCGGIFPTDGAPLFTRIWSAMLPFTAYVKLQMQQMYLGASIGFSLVPIAVLGLGILLPLWPALAMMRRTLLDETTWGLR
jgi:ABC-2 type transport system permease protein